jgi:hypothetical protein
MDSMMSAINISDSSPGERLAEIGAILAEALMRLRRGKSSAFSAECGESLLHISPDESGDAPVYSAEVSND